MGSFAALALLLAPPAGGQDSHAHAVFPAPGRSGEGRVPFAASNVQLLGWLPLADFPGGNVTGNDCWGYTSPAGREYVVLGLSDGTAFVEVTDPGRPAIVDFVGGPANLWRGVKTHAHHAYAVSEGGGGIQVFDLSGIDSGVVVAEAPVLTGGLTLATRTLAIDETSGFLYRAGGGSSQGLVIYDLADPGAPALAGEWHTHYVHEVQAVTWDVAGPYLGREIVFCYMGWMGELRILDATDKGALTTIAALTYPGAVYSHEGWLSADKRHLYLDDEGDDATFGGARTRLFDLLDLSAPSYLGFFASPPSTDHNLYVRGDRIYQSNFRGGLRVFDNSDPVAPVEVGYFDTYPEDDGQKLNSLAYNYPYFASGTIVGSDVEKGLFLWREGPARLRFELVGGVPELLDPASATLEFDVLEEQSGELEPGSVELAFSNGGAFTAVPATPAGGTRYTAALPPQACGEEIAFYLSARASDGATWSDPPAAPTQAHLAHAAAVRTVAIEDPLEVGAGWIAGAPGDTATMGLWIRVNPVGTHAQPEDDHSEDPGVFCFVTGQGTPDGPAGESDVDGGTTTLRSPVFDATGFANPHVAYWRWFSNFQDLFHVDDSFAVDLSNDGGASWISLEVIAPGEPDALGGWIRHEARIADFLAPTSAMRLRFVARDLGLGSIVEAAVDDLELLDYECSLALASVAPASGPFAGGNVVTLTGAGFAPETAVSFGASPAEVLGVPSFNQMTVRVPPVRGPVNGRLRRADLRVEVVVSNPGTDTLHDAYTYLLKQD